MYASPVIWGGLLVGLCRIMMPLRKTVDRYWKIRSAGCYCLALESWAPYSSQIWIAEKTLVSYRRPWNSGESFQHLLQMFIWDIPHLHQQYLHCKTVGIFFKYLSPSSVSVCLCPWLCLSLRIFYLWIITECGHSRCSEVPNPWPESRFHLPCSPRIPSLSVLPRRGCREGRGGAVEERPEYAR